MKPSNLVLGTALMAAVLAMPAEAGYVRLGTVDVSFRADVDTAYSRFGGRLEALRFTATRSDIFCRRIVVTFANGERQQVFSGRLDERNPTIVDLRGRARLINNIRFYCRSNEFRGGKIHIAGETGRYMDEWRRSPDWARFWAPIFGPGNGFDPNYWVVLGRESFEGRHDRETDYARWGGRRIERIGLRPVNGDARCSRVVAVFGNGQRINLTHNELLRRGRLRVYDVPGMERNLVRLNMMCRAVGQHQVTIEILARK